MSDNVIHILFINDDSYVTHLDVKAYKQVGIKVDFSSNIQVIMEKIKNPQINLVLLSLDFTAYDVFKLITLINVEMKGNLPIVVTGIGGGAATEKKLMASGASLFIEQPLPKEFLVEKIKNLLNLKIRKSDRVNLNILSQSFLYIDSKEIPCIVENISKDGFLVSIKKLDSIHIDMQLPFKIKLEENKPFVEFIATVVRVEESKNLNDDEIRIGFIYESFVSNAKIRLKNFLNNSSKELEILKYYL